MTDDDPLMTEYYTLSAVRGDGTDGRTEPAEETKAELAATAREFLNDSEGVESVSTTSGRDISSEEQLEYLGYR